MKKRVFAVFLSAILLLGILPGTVLAVDTKSDITSSGLTIYSVDDATNAVGSYTAGSGTVEVAYDESKNTVTFTLNNATLNGPLCIADNNSNLDAKVVLSGENSITVGEWENAILVYGDLTISGTGKLTAVASDLPAIWSSGDIVVDGSTVQANSDSSNGFYTESNIQIQNDANVSGECGYPLLYATNDIQISGSTVQTKVRGGWGIWSDGGLTINSSTVDVNGYAGAIGASDVLSIADSKIIAYSKGGSGLYTGSDLTISGEATEVTTTSEAEPWEDEDTEAIYPFPGIVGWGNIAITGGKVTASAVDAEGIQGNKNLEISGAKTEVTISNASNIFMALSVGGNITITGGTTTVTSASSGGIHPSGDLTLSGGSLSVESQDHGLYIPEGALIVSDGELNVVSQGEDAPGIRSGSMNISGGKVSVDCPNADYPIALNENGLTYTGGILELLNVGPEGGIDIDSDCYYLVIFDLHYGGECKSSLIKQGEKITIDPPQRPNFTFSGWFTAPSDGTEWVLERDTVTTNMTLHAQWIPLHQHTWSDEWTSNQTHHWYACLGENCNYVSIEQNKGYALHAPGAAATCTEPQICTVCGYVLVAAPGHTPGAEATCTAPQTCTVCGDEIAAALGHSLGEKIPAKEATTTSTGMLAHYICTRCGTYFDENQKPTTAEALTTPQKEAGGSFDSPTDDYTLPTYKPEVTQPDKGGSVSVSTNDPKRGDTVTITPKPDKGYEVDTVTVTDQNGHTVAVKKNSNGTYTFIQPGSRVNIEVTYKPTPPVEIPWNNPFTDVSEGDWYYEAVRFVQERGLMNGYSDGQFGPNNPLSRAQLAQILFNKEGRPGVNYLLTFSDVAGEAWYTEAIRWATSQGIAGGYGNGRFGPNDPITREQLAVMLWRYVGSPAATNKELHFADADEISPFALEAMRWAVENGILNGYGDGRLGPQGQATRAQAAQMLKNFIENQEENT